MADGGYDVADPCARRSALRRPRRLRRAAGRRPRARPEGHDRRGPQPHQRSASRLRGGAVRPARAARSGTATSSGPVRPTAGRPTTGAASSAARPGPASCAAANGSCTCSRPSSPTSTGATPRSATTYERILRFWLDRGVDGFRIDVAHGLVKDEELRDNPGDGPPRARSASATRSATPTTSRRCTTSTGAGARCSTATPVTGWRPARSGCATPRRSPATCARTSCTSRSTSATCSAPGTPARCARTIDTEFDGAARRHAGHLGAVQPRRGAPPHPARQPGTRPGGDAADAGAARASATSTTARNSGCPRSTSRRRPSRTRSGFAPNGTQPSRDGARVPMPWSGDRAAVRVLAAEGVADLAAAARGLGRR